MKDTELGCYHTVEVRNRLPECFHNLGILLKAKRELKGRKATKHLFLKRGIAYPGSEHELGF